MNDVDRFEPALPQITGKRLTYEHLTRKDYGTISSFGELRRQNIGKRNIGR
jgi:hypothetical protein